MAWYELTNTERARWRLLIEASEASLEPDGSVVLDRVRTVSIQPGDVLRLKDGPEIARR